MPRPFAWILATVAVLVTALFGLAIAVYLVTPSETEGALDTSLTDVTVVGVQTVPKPTPGPEPEPSRRTTRGAGGRSEAIRSGRWHARRSISAFRSARSSGRGVSRATSSIRRATARGRCT